MSLVRDWVGGQLQLGLGSQAADHEVDGTAR